MRWMRMRELAGHPYHDPGARPHPLRRRPETPQELQAEAARLAAKEHLRREFLAAHHRRRAELESEGYAF